MLTFKNNHDIIKTMLAQPQIQPNHKTKPPFRRGDIIDFWCETLGRTVIGCVVNIVLAKDGIYDLMIRWNDVFVAVEYCSVPYAIKQIKNKLWRYRIPI
jgi:hypothetical protein